MPKWEEWGYINAHVTYVVHLSASSHPRTHSQTASVGSLDKVILVNNTAPMTTLITRQLQPLSYDPTPKYIVDWNFTQLTEYSNMSVSLVALNKQITDRCNIRTIPNRAHSHIPKPPIPRPFHLPEAIPYCGFLGHFSMSNI